MAKTLQHALLAVSFVYRETLAELLLRFDHVFFAVGNHECWVRKTLDELAAGCYKGVAMHSFSKCQCVLSSPYHSHIGSEGVGGVDRLAMHVSVHGGA